MSTHHVIRIPKTGDKKVVKFFRKLRDKQHIQHTNASLFGTSEQIDLLSESPSVQAIVKADGTAILTAGSNLGGGSILFRRQIWNGNSLEPSAIFDEIELSPARNGQTPLPTDKAIEITEIVREFFLGSFTSANPLFGENSPYAEILRSHQQVITKLEENIAEIGSKLAGERFAIENELTQRKEQLEKTYTDKIAAVEEERSKLAFDYQEKTAEFTQRKKELDDRDNTHARRALRQDLKERLRDHSSGFKLTGDTIGLRTPIHIVTGFALVALGILVVYYASKAASDTATNERLAFLIIKSLGVTIAFIGLLTWYLRWMNRWFETHANAEFQLKQLELDIDRASWVVETALEWRNEQGNTIPEHLMESISRNLFSRTEKDEGADMNPVDHLASVLLGSASALKLKVGENEINLDRKAIREAAKG